ncbi:MULTISPECIES: hypothetical protein [unclassified Pseudoclavibacter]|uniref:hypothetical protein n=1 Tax=unclassified Pseudoclavibacter TaxID=2615177 RepID=UPI001BA8D5DF|nr:hypothetical protein [Pseudoclavibacter sp. Marseille-Q4354]MBS3177205.1 hypothetical protein [Pseudoclavibacter sp. Marseille-Q4354]
MFELITGISDLALTAPTTVPDWSSVMSIPEVKPDLSSSFAQAALRLTTIVAGVAVILCILALAVCGVLIATKGLGNARVQEGAATASLWVLGGLVILGSLTGIAGFAIGFKIF